MPRNEKFPTYKPSVSIRGNQRFIGRKLCLQNKIVKNLIAIISLLLASYLQIRLTGVTDAEVQWLRISLFVSST